jgi:hypothetical protein
MCEAKQMLSAITAKGIETMLKNWHNVNEEILPVQEEVLLIPTTGCNCYT